MKMGGDLTREKVLEAADNVKPLHAYLERHLAQRRSRLTSQDAIPNDLLSTLVRAELEGDHISDANILALSIATLVAGNETTRNTLGWIIHTLASHPDQRAMIASDPTLAGGAVDEVLRWGSPVPGMVRTAVEDTRLRGLDVRKGQHCYMSYLSANRDEDVFPDPDVFDITRNPSGPGLAFGFGEHLCPGASLARLVARVFLEELCARFPTWEITGNPVRIHSVILNGWEHIPVTFKSDRGRVVTSLGAMDSASSTLRMSSTHGDSMAARLRDGSSTSEQIIRLSRLGH